MDDNLRVVRSTRASRIAWAVGLGATGVAATMPAWAESSWMREFVEIACYFVFALMWNLLAVVLRMTRKASISACARPSGHRGSGFAGPLVAPPRGGGGRQAASGVGHFVPKMRSPASPRPGTM